ncbi:MAG: hypothetical protein K0R90_257 [Oscillospiraceae bacterium]|nr:hypothetical protein [Oscillospiraceae bacterium]
MASNFFAMMMRMKYINRWGLMRNTRYESLTEHSLEVAMIAHALGVIHNKRFGGNINTERLALIAVYHDANEIITGDLPTPVKYHNDQIKQAYKHIEKLASKSLIELLPEDMAEEYEQILFPQQQEAFLWELVKAADKISALIKCIEEERAGNTEFVKAKLAQQQALKDMNLKEVDVFLEEFIPSFCKTLDEQ